MILKPPTKHDENFSKTKYKNAAVYVSKSDEFVGDIETNVVQVFRNCAPNLLIVITSNNILTQFKNLDQSWTNFK